MTDIEDRTSSSKSVRGSSHGRPCTIITGAGSGIGRALAVELAQRDHQLILADIDKPSVDHVAESLRRRGTSVQAAELDVRDATAVEALIRGVYDEFGRLDFVYNNAGIAIGGEVRNMTAEDWQRTLDVDLRGVVHGVTAAYPIMIEQGFGHIVNTASVAGLIPAPALTAYAAAKHGVVGLSLSLRAEAAQYGVRVNVVCPGIIDTPMAREAEVRAIEVQETRGPIKTLAISAEACARAMVRGVDRDLPIIVVTRHGRFMHNLFRLSPRWCMRLLEYGFERVIRKVSRP